MKKVQPIDLGMSGYDELFMNDEERQINALPHIFEIPIELIDDFPDHPFQVRIIVTTTRSASAPKGIGERDKRAQGESLVKNGISRNKLLPSYSP